MSASKPELALYAALKEIYPSCEHDYLVSDARLAGKHLIRVDCYIPELKLAVEFDGHYWHKKRLRADTRKAKVLLKAGYRVIRLRETKAKEHLPIINLQDDNFVQLPFEGNDFSQVIKLLEERFRD